MIKHMKKIPSFHHLQEHVSLFLTVIQLSIILFVFIPPINAQTKLIPISEPNDWTKLIYSLSKAKMGGINIYVSLLPPSKTPPICPTCNYSEPYRLDFISWAKVIANLSLRYSNLTGYALEDFQENLNLGYLRKTYIDSMITAGKSINPRLQFITTLPNIYYVDKNATGNGSGSSWTNASKTVSDLHWANINGGDTVYISGGTDSLTYAKVNLEDKRFSSQVVITKGKDAGHNGNVIFQNSGSTTIPLYTAFTFGLIDCKNIKLIDLTFNTIITTDDNPDNMDIVKIKQSRNIIIDSCIIISNGIGDPIEMSQDTTCTISYNHIEVLSNSYNTQNDCIWIGSGAGGHTIIGNTIIAGGINDSYNHKDIIQMNEEGSTDKLQMTIANNILTFLNESATQGQGIYCDGMHSNSFLVYNNIITMITQNTSFVVYNGDGTHSSSIRLFNNTIVGGGTDEGGFDFGNNIDTLIMKNNIMELDSANNFNIQFIGTGGLAAITYKDIDYNQYYRPGSGVTFWDGSAVIHWTKWQALGYDTHGSDIAAIFANKWGTNIVDYILSTGSIGIDAGTDLSAIFTTDIRSVKRLLGAAWDRGAVESK
jgi:hypothetical protein